MSGSDFFVHEEDSYFWVFYRVFHESDVSDYLLNLQYMRYGGVRFIKLFIEDNLSIEEELAFDEMYKSLEDSK
jgi:hypothetical protein